MMTSQTQFYGSRLREARLARALSATALSELVEVAASSISQYEHDKQTPSAQVVGRLSDKLNLPPHFFTTPPTPPARGFLRWRSHAAAQKLARDRAEQKYEWLRGIIKLLSEHVEFPCPRFPNLGSPRDPLQISQSHIEEAAKKVRRLWGLGDGPISDVVRLIENNGGIVVRSEMGDGHLDAFSDLDEGGSGRCYIVLGTDKGSAVRSRHDLGHELAHVFLHSSVPAPIARLPAIHRQIEEQAGRFASAFLMPASTFPLEVYSHSLDALLHLKRRWRVSVASMVMRLFDLGIIDGDRKASLFKMISARKWTRREPLDDEIAPEQPILLQRALDAVLEGGVLDASRLVLLTHLPLSDIERLVGVPHGYLGDDQADPPPQPFQLRLID